MIAIFHCIYYAAAITYILFILFSLIGWKRIPIQQFNASNPSVSVSVIVPARNEEQNILNCMEDLSMQDYPAALCEVIIIDDESGDGTAELVNEFIEVNSEKTFRLIQLKEENNSQTHKKIAINKGIEAARGQLIITADADCRFSSKWISSLVQQYEASNAAMIAAPVCFHNEQTIFEKMQSLEFMGLIGIGAGALRNRLYIMCNGANLAYSKNIFHQVKGFEANNNSASGDDTQLMLKIAAVKENVIFLKSREAIVYTSAKSSLVELIRQRKRWASKIPRHTSMFTLLIAVEAYFLNAGIIVSALWMLLTTQFSLLLFLPFAGKCIVEFIFLFDVSSFFKRKKLLLLFLPAQLFYPFYIILVGAMAPFGTYLWKERKVK